MSFVKIAARVTELVTSIKIALPSHYPYKDALALIAGQFANLPP